MLPISLVLNLLLGIFIFRPRTAPTPAVTMERIIDGDTFVLKSGQIIRLANVDAPDPGLCGANEASDLLTRLLSGKNLRIVGSYNDQWGRLLSLVYVGDDLVNEQMILSGWARYTSGKNDMTDRLQAGGARTRAAKLGLYSSVCRQSENPDDPQCVIKGNHNKDRKIYFFPGCHTYSTVKLDTDEGDQWFCTEAEAIKAGYTKSENCYDKKY